MTQSFHIFLSDAVNNIHRDFWLSQHIIGLNRKNINGHVWAKSLSLTPSSTTVCPGSYYIKWVTTSRTYSTYIRSLFFLSWCMFPLFAVANQGWYCPDPDATFKKKKLIRFRPVKFMNVYWEILKCLSGSYFSINFANRYWTKVWYT